MDTCIPLKKTHDIAFEPRRLHYRWHPWYGQDILTRKAGGARSASAYFCRLPNTPASSKLVEIPRWMFDAAECATMRAAEQPHVDCEALRVLKNTMRELSVSGTESSSGTESMLKP